MAVNPEQQDPASTGSLLQVPLVTEAALRAAVFERLGATRFGLWFGECVRLSVSGNDDTLEVIVPDSFFREWIQDHYSVSLMEAAQAVVGRTLNLSICIKDEIEPPLGDVVKPASPYPDSDSKPYRGTDVIIPLPFSPVNPPLVPPPLPEMPKPLSPPVRDRDQLVKRTRSFHFDRSTTHVIVSTRQGRRLEDFVIGPGNRVAHAAATEMVQSAEVSFNPLVIYGSVGLGKTHLLEGIRHGLQKCRPDLKIALITAEVFTNTFLDAMRSSSLNPFRTRYRCLDALIVDDIHFLSGKRATQDEFLHTFNALIEHGALIALASDQHPRLISRLSDELITRFLGGMVIKLEKPDLATRCAILRASAVSRQVQVPDAVILYIAEHVYSSVRELEGALKTVVAQAVLVGKCLDLELAKTALRDTVRHTSRDLGLRDVERVVCELFQVSPETLKSENRSRALAYPRMLAMYLARKHVGIAYSEIGRYFGGRNHSTVMSAERKVESWLHDEEQNAALPGFETVADLLADLERALRA